MNTPPALTPDAALPPATPIPPTLPSMPMPVRIALGLLGAVMLIGLYQTGTSWSALQQMPAGMVRQIAVGSGIVILVFEILFTAGLVWRHNWGRIGWLVLVLVGLATLFLPHPADVPASELIVGNVFLVLQVVAMVLLFTTPARHWFRRGDAAHARTAVASARTGLPGPPAPLGETILS